MVDYLKERMEYLPGVVGCICIQLFYKKENNDVVGIEINPRFGGGYPLSYYAKADFSKYLIQEIFPRIPFIYFPCTYFQPFSRYYRFYMMVLSIIHIHRKLLIFLVDYLKERNAKIFLRENPEIAEEIERQVRAHYGLGEDGPQDAEKDVDKAKDVLYDFHTGTVTDHLSTLFIVSVLLTSIRTDA